MKKQKHLFAYSFITVLLIALICNGCGRRVTTPTAGTIYEPPACSKYNYGSIRYENTSKNIVTVSCKQIHADITLNPRSSMEIQRIPAGRNYEVTYKDMGKRKGKTQYESFYVTACNTEPVTLR